MRKNIWDTSITSFISDELEKNPFNPDEYVYIDRFANQISQKYLTSSSAPKVMIPRSTLLTFYQGLTQDQVKDINDYLRTFSTATIPFQKTFPLIQTIINALCTGKPIYTISGLNAASLFVYSNYLENRADELNLSEPEVDELVIDLISRQLRKIKFSASEYILYRKLLEQYQTEGTTDYRTAKKEIIGDHCYFSTNAFEEILKSQRFDIVAKKRRVERLVTAADISIDQDYFHFETLEGLLDNPIFIDSEETMNQASNSVEVWENNLEAKTKKLIKLRT